MEFKSVLEFVKGHKIGISAAIGTSLVCGGLGYIVWKNREAICDKIKSLTTSRAIGEHVECGEISESHNTHEDRVIMPKVTDGENQRKKELIDSFYKQYEAEKSANNEEHNNEEPAAVPLETTETEDSVANSEQEEEPQEVTNVNKEPEIISFDEYFDEDNQNDKLTINYYCKDDIVSDERDEVLDHDVIGEDNLDRFGYMSNDPNVLYVRNYQLGIDYEICKIEDSYLRVMYGVIPDNDDSKNKAKQPKVKAETDE